MGTTNDLISIIVPIYNAKEYLPACVDSLLAQTYPYVEIILVDDCSNDGAAELVEEYRKKHANIVGLHHERSEGAGRTRNDGLKIARGDYIAYVDSDDEIEENFCEELLSCLRASQADIAVAGRATYVNGVYTKSKTAPEREVVDAVTAIQYQLRGIYSSHPVWGKLYRRETAYSAWLDEAHVFEDIRYSFDTYVHARKVVFSDKDMYKYKIRPGSVMTSRGERQIDGHTYAALYVYEGLKKYGLFTACQDAYRTFLARTIIRNAREFCRGNIGEEVYKKYSQLQINLMEDLGGLEWF